MPSVTTDYICNALVSLFDEKKIPWEHCLASLMDTCNVMRRSKNGLEKKLCETVCPNLSEIDGDSWHHIHNSCKVLQKCSANISDIFSNPSTVTSNGQKIIETF